MTGILSPVSQPLTRILAMLRFSPLFLLASCSFFGSPKQNDQDLAQHQSTASLYYEGNRYPQALDQVRKGLQIAPDDYKLLTIRAWCYLQLSLASPSRLAQAAKEFERIMELRRLDSQSPQVLLGYGMCHEKIALTKRSEIVARREQLRRGKHDEAETAMATAEFSEIEASAAKHLREAEQLFTILVTRGDLLLQAQNQLMQVRALRKNYQGSLSAGTAYMERAQTQADNIQTKLGRTTVISYEAELHKQLNNLTDKMLTVREFLANVFFELGRIEEAAAELDTVIKIDPVRTSAYFNRAKILQRLDRKSDARRDYEKFLATTRLPPGSQQFTEAVKALGKLKER